MKKKLILLLHFMKYPAAVILPVLAAGLLAGLAVSRHQPAWILLYPQATEKSPWKSDAALFDFRFKVPSSGKEYVLYPYTNKGQDSTMILFTGEKKIAVCFKKGSKWRKKVLQKSLEADKVYSLQIYAEPFYRKYVLLSDKGSVLLTGKEYGIFGTNRISSVPMPNTWASRGGVFSSCTIHVSEKMPLSPLLLTAAFFAFAGILVMLILVVPLGCGQIGKKREFIIKVLKMLLCTVSFLFLLAVYCYYRSSTLDILFLLSVAVVLCPFTFMFYKQLDQCRNERAGRKVDRVFFLLFILLLILPGIFISFEESSLADRRELKKMPSLFLEDNTVNSNCGKEFEEYFSDHIGGRSMMLYGVRKLKNLINIPINENGMWIGKDNWSYYTIQEYFNGIDFDPVEKKHIVKTLKNIAEYCKKHKIKFYLLICPVKAQIYPEYVKLFKNKVRSEKYRMVNVLKEELKSVPVTFIDPTEYLQKLAKEKKEPLLYYRGDDHCSDWGAYHIYRYAIDIVRKDFPSLPVYEVRKENFVMRQARKNGNLDIMNRPPDNEPIFYENLEIDKYYKMGWPFLVASPNRKSVHRLVWFGDSFTFWLLPYMCNGSFKYVFGYPTSTYNIVGEPLRSLKCDVLMLEVWEGGLKYWAKKLKFKDKE